ncbi:SCO-spondin-like [Ostrea edulis]|uniref:SCO-spondin-like n=1 Tax=Ostrea edulis TaxID=37623 RepID=UPI0024AEFCB0|nr:SCO-spondin-like [Ostrea edulis]
MFGSLFLHRMQIILAFVVAVEIFSCINARTISKSEVRGRSRNKHIYGGLGAKWRSYLKARCIKGNKSWSSWSPFGLCSVTCGGGKQKRTRICCNPVPADAVKSCPGSNISSQSCNTNKCPAKANWASWSSYGDCSVTCGGGEQERSRSCINPAPKDGGDKCPGSSVSSQSCNTNGCPVDGGWSEWTSFDACTVTCGGGEQTRYRCCSNPPPEYGGKPCTGPSTSVQICNTRVCPTDGNWASWSSYGDCSMTCGGGKRERSRSCTNPAPKDGGEDCPGSSVSSQSCNTKGCPVDGGWSVWSPFDTCTVTCGGGEQTRYRSCANPPPHYGGKSCTGDSVSVQSCNTRKCPTDGNWTPWSNYGVCSLSCGGGRQDRTRSCTNPAPKDGGDKCLGSYVSSQSCNTNKCPVDGVWSAWSGYGKCSVSCGGGQQQRTRTCSNPTPEYNGKPCAGDSASVKSCNTKTCPTHGNWASWSSYGKCSVTCGGGKRERSRSCTNPAPKDSGDKCPGSSVSSQSCNPKGCPVDGGWSTWSSYSSCSVNCGGGKKIRTRSCSSPLPQYGGKLCAGDSAVMQSCNAQTCPTDGNWASWSAFGACSVTCGGGEQERTRSCTNPAPKDRGKKCTGSSVSSRSCNINGCPVDGGWSAWSWYDICSVSCGGGQQQRTRTCSNPTPEYNGKPCVGDSASVKSCNTKICPTDGNWTPWSSYGDCSVTCGGGEQERSRSCTNPAPKDGGDKCRGPSFSSQSCNTNGCPADGNWASWSTYGVCSMTCGGGEQQRTRSCTNPAPKDGGDKCPGSSVSSRSCNTNGCPVDGDWSAWSGYGTCSVSCGVGQKQRTRTCSNPTPQYNGKPCVGNSASVKSCNIQTCPTDGNWTPWSGYGVCSVTCGGGKQERSRSCTNPAPKDGGDKCPGSSVSSRSCNTNRCPVNGGWSEWLSFDDCTATCGGGQQKIYRSCSNPSPEYGGKSCTGDSTSVLSCNTRKCPTDGNWGSWSSYGDCSVTCGGGKRERSRSCTNPAPKDGGEDCPGSSVSSQTCNTNGCPVDGGWSAWSEYDSCTVTCGGGQQTRYRSCSNPPAYGGNLCIGPSTSVKSCKTHKCPTDGNWASWSSYGPCSVTCGGGKQERSRSCSNPAPKDGGDKCPGSSVSSRSCNTNGCPVDGGWSVWSPFDTCTVTCGGGEQTRYRSCANPPPHYGGKSCSGDSASVQSCNTRKCPTDGNWASWSNYGPCSLTCGGGTQERSRSCTNPAPKDDGEDCPGCSVSSQSCNTNGCPVDGGWSEWSSFDACTVTCGGGEQTRYRCCSNPPPEYGGKPCTGPSTSVQICNTRVCPK